MDTSDFYKTQFSGFHDLMKFRVREILLVSSPYDAFVLEEDGRLSEKIFGEYLDMNLQFVPRIRRVSSAEEAFSAMRERTYDLIITMARIRDMNPLEFGKRVKEAYPGKPVVMLTYDTLNNELLREIRETKTIDKIFYWSGNNTILLAIIKYVEDLGNLESDCREGVQAILVVEDSPWAYSQFLPIIYTEIMKQTSYLISKGINNLHRLLRMRARPKILLAETYEEAIEFFNKYRHNLLGVISDMGYPKEGQINSQAGLLLAKKIKAEIPYLPYLIQSSELAPEDKAHEIGINFLNKNSPSMLLELSTYVKENYGFGDFLFRQQDGSIIARASIIDEFEEIIRILPQESLIFHASRYDFSKWFKARTEFECAEQIRRVDVSDFQNPEELREYILQVIKMYFKRIQEGVITDFGQSKMDMDNSLLKLGSGSLGGKGRGVAFFNSILSQTEVFKKYNNIRIKTPQSFVICSEVFEEFLEINSLQEMAIVTEVEETIAERFLNSELPLKIRNELRILIDKIHYPLAIRSSSILEDSQMLPFAGIYSTFMLPNNHQDPEIRLQQLLNAIKLVYASVYYKSPKRYVKNADLRIEEEKMAILIQQIVGDVHGDVFYPVISGVAQSYNFYPISYMQPEHGIVSLALGLGKAVVDGEQVYRFSPAYPKMNPDFASTDDFLKKSQNKFYGLKLADPSIEISQDTGCTLGAYTLDRAEKDGTLSFVGSTYSKENDTICDTLMISGPRVVSFAPVLKLGLFPLTNIIKDLFVLGKNAFGTDIEIEFAINIPADYKKEIEFYFLQIRPLVSGRELQEVMVNDYPDDQVMCKSSHTIGNGIYENIYDIIYVNPDTFDRSKTRIIGQEIGELNQYLFIEARNYLLLGFGRLGSSDPWLGIPLTWSQISQAKVVVESDWETLQVEPSLGSHFHHNLISLRMGYFHIGKENKSEFVDWAWLKRAPILKQTEYVRLIRLKDPLTVKIDGHGCHGVIIKPN
ncbi:phosphoenolpyruvate synthase/pyruvate phosphate dikinase [Desulfosporosinus orientis DSM 765]|uniref:Phosphoenolpyruvate synthase/pyruvate phosphate dikinase n=1 Tax=Desulfosporosinus orientis (strain ATCC 19365 / DSM 765 / NCIMB 8382 / VKM B-1628 / Singapore I) TaxID=768706 RepID=G7WGU4_DESOD|nr:PEP/pyruvate-binding domain-containing protein [Desulfosporosinus orientis]AET68530.1 phosphoenolpyruvate synthase/pyruvate phosphate dikinase [Desulfosporosinus orientis DSM 765]